jgi:hypothetical protein
MASEMTRRTGFVRRIRAGVAPLAKRTLLRVGGYDAIRRLLPSHRLAILRYHAICGPSGYRYADPGICITPEAFEQHVAYLTRRYAVLHLEDAVAQLIEGKPLPRNAVAIAFHDGVRGQSCAARTLAAGAGATFYIRPDAHDGQPFLRRSCTPLTHCRSTRQPRGQPGLDIVEPDSRVPEQ